MPAVISNAVNLSLVRKIAAKVRRELFKNRYKYNCYYEDLEGMCAIASYSLFCELNKCSGLSGCAIGLALADSHCFVVVNNKIVDITASQFGKEYPKVYIADVDDDLGCWWQDADIFYSDYEICLAFKNKAWPDDQNPFWWKESA